jgi:hypothetical protein
MAYRLFVLFSLNIAGLCYSQAVFFKKIGNFAIECPAVSRYFIWRSIGSAILSRADSGGSHNLAFFKESRFPFEFQYL